MFDRLEDILIHFEELMQELASPGVTDDPKRFQRLMKEQAELTPLVETYKAYNEYIKGLVEKYHDELVEDDLLSLLYKVMESL